jgi:hypothetical protein
MQRSRLLVFALAFVASSLFAACETEEPKGRIGTAVFAPGPDGSGNAAGASGSAARDAGAGRDANCSVANCGGNAGRAGSGGQTAGSSGSAGGAPLGPLCVEACKVDADCESLFSTEEYHCNAETQRCEGFASPCRGGDECIPGASQWLWSCSSDHDCYFFDDDVCVSIAGVGRCARLAPSPNAPDGGCVFPVPDAIELPRLGAAGKVLVCSDRSQQCRASICVIACKAEDDCYSDPNGAVCNVQTGVCGCESDQDCRVPGVSRCDTTRHRCECADDTDCEDVPNTDKCIAGHCGCDSTAACTAERLFSGTRYVCE